MSLETLPRPDWGTFEDELFDIFLDVVRPKLGSGGATRRGYMNKRGHVSVDTVYLFYLSL